MLNWKALYVAPRSEKKVASRLQEMHLEAYVPQKKERKQWSDRIKTVITPLINGYVFVRLNETQRELVFKVQGVIQYVRSEGRDAIVKDREIEVLKSIEEKGYYVEALGLEKLNAGDRTVINEGQFKGLTGIVEKSAGKETYTICLESIGYSLKVNLSAELLRKQP